MTTHVDRATPGRGRLLLRIVVDLGLVLVAVGAGLWLHAELNASLPQVDGERVLPGLAAEVRVERDALGVPVIRGTTRLDVARALEGLEDGDQELVVMRYLEEMNSREIGEALGMPEGTVRRRLVRCRELLADRLSQYAGDGAEQ